MNKKLNLSLLAILAVSVSPLWAQEVIELDDITLSANLEEIEVDRTGASVEVIEGEEIDQAQSLTLSEFLGQYAGVSVNRSGPIGGESKVLVRGARQYEVKVLVDGIDVSDPSLVQSYFNFGGMGMGDISRIEIVKGSQSSLYGGSAVGGVISITTKTPEVNGFSGSSSIEYGSYNTGAASLTLAHGGDSHSVAVKYSKIQSDGFSAADENDGNSEADGFIGERISLNASYNISDSFKIGVSGFSANNTADQDGWAEVAPDDWVFGDNSDTYLDDQIGGRIFAEYSGNNINLQTSYSMLSQTRESIGGTEYKFVGQRNVFDVLGTYSGIDSIKLSLGAQLKDEFATETKTDYSNYPEVSKFEVESETSYGSVFVGLSYSPTEQLDLDFTIRNDWSEAYDSSVTWRAAAAWRPLEGTVLKAIASTGVRNPSVYELTSIKYGNLDLIPEETQNFEIGVEHELSKTSRIGATVFMSNTESKVEWVGELDENYDYTYDKDGDIIGQYVQAEGKTKRQGLEFSGSAALTDRINTNFAYTYLKTEDATGAQLARIPKHELNVGIDAELYEGLVLGVQGKMVRDVMDDAYGTPLDDYNLVNARLGYKIGDGEIYARVENLLDEQYQTAKGYGTSDRAFYVGYSVNF